MLCVTLLPPCDAKYPQDDLGCLWLLEYKDLPVRCSQQSIKLWTACVLDQDVIQQ
jgi:hypothetical protein